MDFVIETDVPMPVVQRKPSELPLAKLQVGQSFVIAVTDPAKRRAAKAQVTRLANKLEITTVVAEIETGLRVWRTA